jgi:hypothetical protein
MNKLIVSLEKRKNSLYSIAMYNGDDYMGKCYFFEDCYKKAMQYARMYKKLYCHEDTMIEYTAGK